MGLGIWDLEIRKTPIAVIDFETTGQYPDSHRIVEATVVRIEPDGKFHVAFDSLINPERRIDADATNVRGITDKDVSNAPTFGDVAAHFFQAISNSVVASYNIYFDMPFLENEMTQLKMNHKLPHFCVMWIRKAIVGDRVKLGVACEEAGISLKNAHRALDDTLATAKLLKHLLKTKRDVSTFRELAGLGTYKFSSSFEHPLVPLNIHSKLPKGKNLKPRSGK